MKRNSNITKKVIKSFVAISYVGFVNKIDAKQMHILVENSNSLKKLFKIDFMSNVQEWR